MFLCGYRFLCGQFTRYRIVENENFKLECLIGYLPFIYEGWNFNSGNYLFTADTK